MRLTQLILLVFATSSFVHTSLANVKNYNGYKVLRVTPDDRRSVTFLRNMMANETSLDFWKEPTRPGVPATIMVSPEDLRRIETDLTRAGVGYEVQVDNLQSTMKKTMQAMSRARGRDQFDLNDFNTLENIYSWMSELKQKCRSGLWCKVYSIGNSFEGRPIYIFKMSKPGSGRKAYWIDATIHAREWITTATITNIMNHMATGADDDAVRLTDAYDWYFLPVVNPDGYRYTWTNDRMWRKNRRPFSSSCVGVDLNRNFKYNWGRQGVSRQPCSEIFCGTRGTSEPETAAVSSELIRLSRKLVAVLTLHSYGRMWMFPFDNTVNFDENSNCERAPDHEDLMTVSNAVADAIQRTYHTEWSWGNSCEVIYPTTGATDSFAKGAAGIKYAFCAELRGDHFIIEASQIPLSFREIWNGVVAMCDAIEA